MRCLRTDEITTFILYYIKVQNSDKVCFDKFKREFLFLPYKPDYTISVHFSKLLFFKLSIGPRGVCNSKNWLTKKVSLGLSKKCRGSLRLIFFCVKISLATFLELKKGNSFGAPKKSSCTSLEELCLAHEGLLGPLKIVGAH